MASPWTLLPLAALLLGSATPPPREAFAPPRLSYAYADCDSGSVGCFGVAEDEELTFTIVPLEPEQPIASLPPGTAMIAEAGPMDEGPTPQKPAPRAEEPAESPIKILISLPEQKAYVFDNGELIATSPVSTGKPGHRTPVGTFRILQKRVEHYSNLYDNAPMPYMQRLTHSGIALHAGALPGYPASHGCIRFPWSFAKKLYGLTDFQTKVTITSEHPASSEEAAALLYGWPREQAAA